MNIVFKELQKEKLKFYYIFEKGVYQPTEKPLSNYSRGRNSEIWTNKRLYYMMALSKIEVISFSIRQKLR